VRGRGGTLKRYGSEIDHNFARAHRIVTSSILPIVERYGQESEAVWEGSKVRQSCVIGEGVEG